MQDRPILNIQIETLRNEIIKNTRIFSDMWNIMKNSNTHMIVILEGLGMGNKQCLKK